MPKAKTKVTETNGTPVATDGHLPDYQVISRDQLAPSATNPRKRFPEASITELAESIREKGIIEPLTVRTIPLDHETLADRRFEIVCGERRWRASGEAKLAEVPCIVRDLTDEQVLDIQIHENLHREDVHPMDEAYGYKFLQDKIGCEVSELAVRVGKTEAYVLNRLKLNQLIPEVQKDIEDGLLPIAHALEIAKFAPDSQLSILNEGAYRVDRKWHHETQEYSLTSVKTEPTRLNEFREWISEKILWRLAKAPFDRKATNLRADGLACISCPNRTGANAVLFDKGTSNNDSCLDPICWKGKAQVHVKLTRERLAHDACVEIEKIPLVNTDSWGDKDDVLGYEKFTQILKRKVDSWNTRESNKPCDASITTLDVSDKNYGKLVTICLRSSKCKVHNRNSSSISTTSKSSNKNDTEAREAELIQKRERREELFDIRVSDLVRKRIFRQAAEIFVGEFQMSNNIPNFFSDLLTKLWLSTPGYGGPDKHTVDQVVKPLMRDITDEQNGFNWSSIRSWYDGRPDSESEAGKAIAKLSERNQKLILFLFVHGNKGNTYSDRFSTQKEVLDLAEQYGLNYDLLDAQVRVQVAGEKAKKHLDLFKAYLAEVEAGKKTAKIPRPFAPSYKPVK